MLRVSGNRNRKVSSGSNVVRNNDASAIPSHQRRNDIPAWMICITIISAIIICVEIVSYVNFVPTKPTNQIKVIQFQTDEEELKEYIMYEDIRDMQVKLAEWDLLLASLQSCITSSSSSVTKSSSQQLISSQIEFYTKQIQQMETWPNLRQIVVCEIGFNDGHTALTLLESSSKVRYFAFGHENKLFKIMNFKYPHRFSAVVGDPHKKMPDYERYRKQMALQVDQDYCNFIIVDLDPSMHDSVNNDIQDIENTLRNFRKYSHKNKRIPVVMNNAGCKSSSCEKGTVMWMQAQKDNIISQEWCFTSDGSNGFCLGEYIYD